MENILVTKLEKKIIDTFRESGAMEKLKKDFQSDGLQFSGNSQTFHFDIAIEDLQNLYCMGGAPKIEFHNLLIKQINK